MKTQNQINVRILCSALIVLAFNIIFSLPAWVNTIEYSQRFLLFQRVYNDSWIPMKNAVDYFAKEGRKEGLYSYTFFTLEDKFVYPPTSLLPVYLLSKITNNKYRFILKGVSWLCIILMIIFVVMIIRRVAVRDLEERESPGSRVTIVLSATIFTLLFYPIMKAYNLGQIQTWLNTIFAGLLYCWIRNWHALAGALLGFMCLIKPHYFLILVWGTLRRKWNFVTSCFGVILPALLISFMAFGVRNHLEYFTVLSYLSKHGQMFQPNQSMNGLLNRWINYQDFHVLEWQADFLAPYDPTVYIGTLVFSLIMVTLALGLPVVAKKQGDAIDLIIIAITSTMISPTAWEHHYGLLLPTYAYLLAYLLRAEFQGKKVQSYLIPVGISYLLVSSFIPGLDIFAHKPYWNIVLSYLFFGALILIIYSLKLLFDRNLMPVANG